VLENLPVRRLGLLRFLASQMDDSFGRSGSHA
jgi:hypothetical protein